jgi:hypothetical protein
MTEDYTLNKAYAFNYEMDKFNIRKMILPRTNKLGLTKVIIEVCRYMIYDHSTSFIRVSTDVWILPNHWSKKKQEVFKDAESEVKNKQIDQVYSAIKNFINSKGKQTLNQVYLEKLNLSAIRELFPVNTLSRKSLTDYIEEYYKLRKAKLTPHGTLKEFKTVMNRIIAYDAHKGKKTYFEDIGIVWSDDFELYLRNIVKNKKNIGYGDGTIEKTYTVLITVLNHYFDRRKSNHLNITDDFRIKGKNGFKRGTKSINDANPLNDNQLSVLATHQFAQEHLQKIRDRFLWQCSTGMRYGDAFKVTKSNIDNNWLYYTPSKTRNHRVKVAQPLNSTSLDLLKKYDFDMTKLVITNQAYNRELVNLFNILKEKYPKLDFRNDYGTHCGRDTFISKCVQQGVDWNTILGWVGQSSFTIMKRYIKVTNQYQSNQMKKAFNIRKPKK